MGRDRVVMKDLQLDDVLDRKYKTGVAFTKCCHAFHMDCLQQYITAESTVNPQKQYMKAMVGFDDDCIQCPMCKTFKNAWQPVLPLGLDIASGANTENDTNLLEPYIDFCSSLINNHIHSEASEDGKGFTEILDKRSIMAVDIKKDPDSFIRKISSVVTHMILDSTLMKN